MRPIGNRPHLYKQSTDENNKVVHHPVSNVNNMAILSRDQQKQQSNIENIMNQNDVASEEIKQHPSEFQSNRSSEPAQNGNDQIFQCKEEEKKEVTQNSQLFQKMYRPIKSEDPSCYIAKQSERIDLSQFQKRRNHTNHESFAFGSELLSNGFGLHGSAHLYDNFNQNDELESQDAEEIKFDDRSVEGAEDSDAAHSSSIESNNNVPAVLPQPQAA